MMPVLMPVLMLVVVLIWVPVCGRGRKAWRANIRVELQILQEFSTHQPRLRTHDLVGDQAAWLLNDKGVNRREPLRLCFATRHLI
ncbi:hypothetical protein F5Y18DRAFT_378230 [Xylariaceae sp. FL1019]|nr:hypothetical protein F5Y18DRAFT_378230 [Xylariaceae sp. FL1019]